MKVLVDECIPRKLAKQIVGHDVQTVPEAGFAAKSNGELLELAEQAGVWSVSHNRSWYRIPTEFEKTWDRSHPPTGEKQSPCRSAASHP